MAKNKLPKSIIKKHGISKKAWRIFRGSKKKSRSKPKSKAKTKTRRSNTVGKKKAKNTGFKLPQGTAGLIGNVGYGFIRERLSDALAKTNIVQRIPATEFTDEAVMLGLNWGIRKLGANKIPILKNLVRSQKSIEQARIGQTLADMQQQTGGVGKQLSKGIFIN